MLDILREGTRTRTSLESNTTVILEEENRVFTLGGAANVAYWLALGTRHQISLITRYGKDDHSQSLQLRQVCPKRGERCYIPRV